MEQKKNAWFSPANFPVRAQANGTQPYQMQLTLNSLVDEALHKAKKAQEAIRHNIEEINVMLHKESDNRDL